VGFAACRPTGTNQPQKETEVKQEMEKHNDGGNGLTVWMKDNYPMPEAKTASQGVVVEAPMSFSGSYKRTMNWRSNLGVANPWGVLALDSGIWLLWLPSVWAVILCWYCIFGLFLIPYRAFRRSSRHATKQQAQHEEMLDAVKR
jgi:hypothetical protein